MIKMFTARTSEIDEIEDAVAEIKSQIDFSVLRKNSGGLILCHMDFVESGVVAALCEALPFGVIGMTSMASADEHGYGLFDLTLTVFTSDEVSFEVGMTDSICRDNYQEEISGVFGQMRSRVQDNPAMIVTFVPYVRDVAGYEVLDEMDKVCNGVPVWGSFTNSIDFTHETVQTICNGKNLRYGLAMMFINSMPARG